MEKIKSIWQGFKDWFNNLPSAVKVIIYSSMSAVFAQIGTDIAQIDAFWKAYVVIGLTVATNITAYLILREKENGQEG